MVIAADQPLNWDRVRTRQLVGDRRIQAAAGLCGGALAVLVGIDGSPVWQAVRVLGVAAVTAFLLAALRRSHSRWRGGLAIGAGIFAIAIAVGFAPYLVKRGSAATTAAAIVLGVAGFALTADGTVVVTRGRRWWTRTGVGLGVLFAAAVVAWVVGPAVAATNVPLPELGATPARVGLAYDDVTVETSDGVSLAAWYVPSSNRAAIVLLHGAGSTRSNVLDHAAVLAEAGFGVLMIDARGHGNSGGRAMDFGWHGDADIAAATDYLARRGGVDRHRIGAVGMSMGGEEALGASGTNALLRAVVAEGATARVAADEAWLSERYGVRGVLTERLERVQDWVTDVLTSASVPASLRAAVESSDTTRYLLITAGRVSAEGHAAAFITAGAPDRVRTWTVPGADHTDGLDAARQDWTNRVVDFLTGELLADTST